jgi:hypothetical protein
MVTVGPAYEQKMERYITDIADTHPDAFSAECWATEASDIGPRLYQLMGKLKLGSTEEETLLKEVMRLIVVSFVMSQPIIIAEETKMATLSRLKSYTDSDPHDGNICSPRMMNYQLKYFFSRLQAHITGTILNKLQLIFKSSKGCDKWLLAFWAVLGLAMALEHQQKTIYSGASIAPSVTEDVARLDAACREMDDKYSFIVQLFRWKYNRKINPFKGMGQVDSLAIFTPDQLKAMQEVAELAKENGQYEMPFSIHMLTRLL